jgi:hypothetical protein
MLPEKMINFQPAHQFQPKPRATEVLYLFNPHLIDIDFYPFRLNILDQSTLDASAPSGGILNTKAA